MPTSRVPAFLLMATRRPDVVSRDVISFPWRRSMQRVLPVRSVEAARRDGSALLWAVVLCLAGYVGAAQAQGTYDYVELPSGYQGSSISPDGTVAGYWANVGWEGYLWDEVRGVRPFVSTPYHFPIDHSGMFYAPAKLTIN